MARWDKILALPVQSPPTLEFSSADLKWSTVEGWSDNIEKVAFIPFDRVDHFLEGESKNKEFPTRFYVEARRRGHSSKEKVDGVLEFTMYRCAFGPDDRREGGNVRPSRSTYVPKKKSSGRPSIKRGCQCYFFVKRLIAKPSAALIIYKQEKHVDEKGLPCHGPQDAKAVGTRAMFAPYISEDLRLLLTSLLHLGVGVETIMHIYGESVEKQGGPCNRDDLLTHRYVRRLERSIRRSKYDLDEDDAVSIEMWSDRHESDIFFREDFSDSNPFTLGIQTKWQLQQMIRFGNRSLVASDSRFGTNKLKYPVHSILVFDSNNKAIPVAWIITPRSAYEDAYKWIRALYRRVHSTDPTWKLAGFIVDDPSADVLTIREVFQCSVLICFWRVRHAWHKNLVEKCPETELRSEMSRRLGEAVYSICKGNGDVDLFEDFMEDFLDCLDFVDYFRAIWFPRIGMWTAALKTLPLASQETCAAIEYYHHQLKLRLLSEKDPNVYQRTDWLVNKLWAKVHSSVWLDEYPRKEDFARYRKDHWTNCLTPWHRALKIADSDVVLEGRHAKVISQHVGKNAHVVQNPGSEFALCDCNWSVMGNLCKHVMKVSRLCRKKGSAEPSISLFKFNQTLINILHCPPHDSLICDHAVSLAVCVQRQLNALVDLECVRTSVSSVEKELTSSGSANRDTNVVNDNPCTTENVLSSIENASGVGDESRGDVAGDLGGEKVISQVSSENGVCGETAETINVCSEMDIDPLSLLSSNGIPSTDTVLGNEEMYLLSENLSSNNIGFAIRDDVREDISDEDCREKMVFEGVCGDVSEGNITGCLMDVDPQSIKIPPSAAEQCTMRTDDINRRNVAETTSGNSADVNHQSIQTSPSRSTPIELHTVNAIGPIDTILENEDNDLENGNQDANVNPFFANKTATVDGDRCGSAFESRPDDVVLVNDYAVNGVAEQQTSAGLVATETGVHGHVLEDGISVKLMDNTSQSIEVTPSRLEVKQQPVSCGVSVSGIVENVEEDMPNESQGIVRGGVQDGVLDEELRCGTSNQLASQNGVCCDIAEETVCCDIAEETVFPESIVASPPRVDSVPHQTPVNLATCEDDVCSNVVEESVTMAVDPESIKFDDVDQQTTNGGVSGK